MQQGDVILRQTLDDGDICVTDGVVDMNGGLETSAYLSLFGGNFNGSTWWGNLLETDPNRQYVSRTQTLLQGIPAVTGNLIRITNAVRDDLQGIVDAGAASSVESTVTMPGVKRIQIDVEINAEGEPERFQFFTNWGDTE